MAVTREQFDQGMTYEAYKAQMTRNRERLEAAEQKVQVAAADVAAVKQLPKAINVLAIVEDWCGDVVANLPILDRLARESGKLNVRCVLRDQTPIIDQYLKDGQFKSIPVFVFLDEKFNEIGNFKERPASVTELRAQRRKAVYASDPAFGAADQPVDQLPEDVRVKLNAALQAMRDETTPFANGEVVREIRQILAKTA
jgi:hypothetical protein